MTAKTARRQLNRNAWKWACRGEWVCPEKNETLFESFKKD